MTPNKGTRATRAQIIRMHALMTQHLTKNSDGTFSYADGWSDLKISEEIECKENSVSLARLDLFGKLRMPSTGPVSSDEQSQRIETLEQRVLALESQVQDLIEFKKYLEGESA